MAVLTKTVTQKVYKCNRPTCEHEWIKRGKGKPRICPKCKSARWDVSLSQS